MVKFVSITESYAAIYSCRQRSNSNQNPSSYGDFGGFKGNYPLVIINKIHIWNANNIYVLHYSCFYGIYYTFIIA